MTRSATLRDVADQAYVSPATVSRVINSPGLVKSEVRRRVRVAMKALNYRVTPHGLVGLVIPDRSNPFFVDLGLMFQDRLEHHGLQTFIVSSDGERTRELALIRRCMGLGLQGVIYVAAETPDTEVLAALEDGDIPVVIFDRKVEGARHDAVALDNVDGMGRAIDYLAAHGHRRIGHLRGPADTHTGQQRYLGFGRGLELNGLALREEWVWEGRFAARDGWRCGAALIETEDCPTAVVCANDLMALGLMQILQQEGWALPRDLSIVGFDDIETSKWVFPALTTVSQRSDHLVDVATEMLTDRLSAVETVPGSREIDVSPQLIPRASVASVTDS